MRISRARGLCRTLFRSQDFDIWYFTRSGGSERVAFAKHWGHVPQSPGFRYRVSGVCCSAGASDLEEADLDRVLAGTEPNSGESPSGR